MSWNTLLLDRHDDGVAVLTINRPDKLNALNADVLRELGEVAAWAAQTPDVGGLVITGAGPKAFVAGADISELAAMGDGEAEQLARRGQDTFRALETLGKPVIAAVNGFALGGGCELALACHIRLASPNAKFGQPEVKLGLIPGYGGTVRLPRLVGRGHALELLLGGGMIDAETAARIGLVNRVVTEGSVLDEAVALLRTILAQGPLAVRLCLEAVDRGSDLPVPDALALEARLFGQAGASSDRHEGTRAFLEKRAPSFQGR